LKTRYFLGVAVICLAIFIMPVCPQTLGTTLSLGVHWDDNTAVAGTVVIALVQVTGTDTVIATRPLNAGSASLTVSLATNSLYHITVLSPTGIHLARFPITTALVNPQNLQRGAMSMVLRKADRSLKSANVSVSMNF